MRPTETRAKAMEITLCQQLQQLREQTTRAAEEAAEELAAATQRSAQDARLAAAAAAALLEQTRRESAAAAEAAAAESSRTLAEEKDANIALVAALRAAAIRASEASEVKLDSQARSFEQQLELARIEAQQKLEAAEAAAAIELRRVTENAAIAAAAAAKERDDHQRQVSAVKAEVRVLFFVNLDVCYTLTMLFLRWQA